MTKKNKTTNKSNNQFLFGKRNYQIMLVGIVFIAIGFILMSGGSSTSPDTFNEEIFSPRRIRLAPTLVLIGLGIQIFAIFTNPKKK